MSPMHYELLSAKLLSEIWVGGAIIQTGER